MHTFIDLIQELINHDFFFFALDIDGRKLFRGKGQAVKP